MTLMQSFSPPFGLGAAKQFALDGGSLLYLSPLWKPDAASKCVVRRKGA